MKKKIAIPLVSTAILIAGGLSIPQAFAATAVLQFTAFQYDSPGKDTRSNASRNAEYFRITNKTKSAANIKGFTVKDAAGHTFTFPDHIVNPGRSVYVHTGNGTRGKQPNGTTDSTRFYWNSGNYVWNNDKDTATLRSGSGRAYDSCKWTKPGSGSTSC
jgi:hypothetical protein